MSSMLLSVTCLVVAVLARPSSNEQAAKVVSMRREMLLDQSYKFRYETSNNIRREEAGVPYPSAEPETGNFVQSGSYQFSHPDGTLTDITFVADLKGYRPVGDILPIWTGVVDIQDV